MKAPHQMLTAAVLAAAALILSACGHGRDIIPGPPGQYSASHWGIVEGTRNGLPMLNPRISAFLPTKIHNFPCDSNTFGFSIGEYNGDCARFGLVFERLSRRARMYAGRELAGRKPVQFLANCEQDTVAYVSWAVLDCDAGGFPYAVTDTTANRLEVSGYSETTGLVSGSYDIFLHRSPELPPMAPGWPQKVRLTGRFETKLRTTQFYQ